jgi:hypothetical protein
VVVHADVEIAAEAEVEIAAEVDLTVACTVVELPSKKQHPRAR